MSDTTKIEQEVDIPAPNPEVFKDSGSSFQVGKNAKAQVVDGVQKNAIGLESTADHKHVAKVWQDQCTPIETFAANIEAQRIGKVDLTKPFSHLNLSDDLTLPDGMGFTKNGLMSLVVKYTDYPSGSVEYHLDNGDYSTIAHFVNRELGVTREDWATKQAKKKTSKFTGTERNVLIRTRPDPDNGGAQVARMIGSDRYGIVDNHELMGMLIEGFKKTPYGGDMSKALASHTYTDLDRMHGNILLPDDMKQYPDSDYGIGISFSNSEIGTNTVRVSPFLFRAICLNGCIWGKQDSTFKINKVHKGTIDMDELQQRIIYVCTVAVSEGRNLMTQMEYSKEAMVPKDKIASVITYLTQQNKLTVSEGRAWYAAFQVEPWENGFGVVNGLTRAAREYTGDARVSMEMKAGAILTPSLTASKTSVASKWQKVVERASELSTKEVERYTRIAA